MIRGLRPSVLLSRLEAPPAWLDSWPLSLALCLHGVVAMGLLRGEAPASTLETRVPGAAEAS
ncbi:hypothetical protein D187_006338 [Cystobacter fuscus DSM 2262]|uniref:Uncharacterized protein n=1 Tax=Cystobacter fuscus (strain ATCC 25194 / DSM 2262 / NBRC 100088 / M29) TaxID=1242864 RepID=S9R1Z1_CYSF2|nr:hypothetical protein [Cystobacter fuscus]EPX62928.1 hypothetical protein D187_006338 [Cystobacter fuscus DSM 2262]